MRLDPFDLHGTLSCGQVFRWRRDGDWWNGIIDGKDVRVSQQGCELLFRGDVSGDEVGRYFRADDDLDHIYQDILINCGDEKISGMLQGHNGLRLIRQDPWECSASYILATFSNIPRIQQMIERICDAYGERLPSGRCAFPTPEVITSMPFAAGSCGLGFRCGRFVEFAEHVANGDVDFDGLKKMPYAECIKELKRLPGIGDKVADCIALFSLDHLESFPVDVRIMKSMRHLYGLEGSYKKIGDAARMFFGQYAGYAQEYIYVAMEGRTKGL